MVAAAELAALRLKDLPSVYHNNSEIRQKDRVFFLLDKNGDGRISIEELTEVMEELGGQREDAQEMMQLLDSNSDGSLSSDEFDSFQKQVNADVSFFHSWKLSILVSTSAIIHTLEIALRFELQACALES